MITPGLQMMFAVAYVKELEKYSRYDWDFAPPIDINDDESIKRADEYIKARNTTVATAAYKAARRTMMSMFDVSVSDLDTAENLDWMRFCVETFEG